MLTQRVGILLCAAGVVDAVLIPEVPFTIKGPHGLFKYLEGVLEKKGHCVVCIAEGAGQVCGRTRIW
jgi:6-phosphofructokinase 1